MKWPTKRPFVTVKSPTIPRISRLCNTVTVKNGYGVDPPPADPSTLKTTLSAVPTVDAAEKQRRGRLRPRLGARSSAGDGDVPAPDLGSMVRLVRLG